MKRNLLLLVIVASVICFWATGVMAGKGGIPTQQYDMIPWNIDFGQGGKVALVGLGPSDDCEYEFLMVIKCHGLEPGVYYHVGLSRVDSSCGIYPANNGGKLTVTCTVCCWDLSYIMNDWGVIVQSYMSPIFGPPPVYGFSGLWLHHGDLDEEMCPPLDE